MTIEANPTVADRPFWIFLTDWMPTNGMHEPIATNALVLAITFCFQKAASAATAVVYQSRHCQSVVTYRKFSFIHVRQAKSWKLDLGHAHKDL
jgi:hypothetical protein